MTTDGNNYGVEVAGTARRDLRRLPGNVATAIIEFITGPLVEKPQRLSKPLRNELRAYRSARRGEYRMLFRIDEAKHAIVVVSVNHRAHIYRPR
ncbi:type II toxin-antitoxin system RelE/ParE family toxin [Mycolicibacterium sp. GF69]|uniref:type II toxin-antitoxin system RelE family toxin n=1 Tax=Mycolicibacterium sp. GF69 TaxID=2267251 RepID=UPI000DCC7D87|nr:type II toxin-antitoxin system RelE/ParE family toxin [Mycolicibacterium sp. GF69]RAV18233.1 type II toxin-antitoxin system RelE/ParE family toxin [Mycolicibacterium sp. GF69]